MKILLDYFFPITTIEPTQQASTDFLNQALAVVKPKVGVTPGTITLCTSATQAATLTDNADIAEFFNGGHSRLYVLPMADLDLATILAAEGSKFFTVLISSDFDDTELADLDLGTYKGVTGVSSDDTVVLQAQAVIERRVAFFTTTATKGKNLFYAFGKLLSNVLSWKNQQYIQMPFDGGVDELGEANAMFADKISFVITDDEFGKRLALFAAGAKAIFAPYIKKNLEIDLQSKALSYISGNQPAYTRTEAALIEDELQKVMQTYVDKGYIAQGTAEVKLEEENFVGSGYFNISEPKALWRIFGEMKQTLEG